MKTKYIWILIPTMFCCQPKASQTEVKDSTSLKSDNIKESIIPVSQAVMLEEPEIVEPPIDSSQLTIVNFNIGVSSLSDDKRENKAISKLQALFDQYKNRKYATIEIVYVHDDPVMPGRINEHDTWYYDADRNLTAYKNEYKSDRTTSASIYLFDKESLAGAFMSSDFYDEGASYENGMVEISSLCPNCGVSVTNDDGAGYVVTVLDQSDANKYESDIFKSHDDMIIAYKDVKSLTREADHYQTIILPNPDSQSDSIKYSINPNLVRRYFKNAVVSD